MASAGINDSDWHQLTLTYSQASGTANLFLDGQLVASESGFSGAQYGQNGWNIYVGSFLNAQNFAGLIDNVRFMPAAISPRLVRARLRG